jgi:hypothetical protein
MGLSFGNDFILIQGNRRGLNPTTVVGPFSPTNIAGLTLWFDASGLVANTTNSFGIVDVSGNVSQWNDLSSNANTLTQTGSARPTLQTAAQNSLNTVRFTGASNQTMPLTTAPVNVDSAYTICAVIRRGGPTGTNQVLILGQGANVSGLVYHGLWYTDTNLYTSNSTGNFNSSTTESSTAYNQASWDLTGSTGHIFFNGANISGSAGANATTGGVYNMGWCAAGGLGYCNVEIAEVCLYNTVLSTANRQSVEGYLKSKWATP